MNRFEDPRPQLPVAAPGIGVAHRQGLAADQIRTITAGLGAPTSVEPANSLYIRIDGTAANERLYITSGGGTWLALTLLDSDGDLAIPGDLTVTGDLDVDDIDAEEVAAALVDAAAYKLGGVAFDPADIAAAVEQVIPIAVLGAWAVDGDGARTNGGGLVGTTPTLTEQVAALAKVENGGVIGNLSAVNAGYGATYKLFPDAPVAEADYAYFGAAVPFCEFALDMSATPATYDAAGVIEWFYWDGAAWAALTISHDNTHASTKDGSLSFTRDGAITFVPPADWTAVAVGGQSAYWIRAGIAAGKAANMTQVPITNTKEHELVTPNGGHEVRQDGTITSLRLVDAAATLHTSTDVKFMLVNFTTGAHSGELTFVQDVRAQVFSDLDLACAAGDELGVVVTQEDGTAEPSGVMLEVGITLEAA